MSLCMSQESQEWGTSIPVSHESHIGAFSSSTGEGSLIQGGKGAHWCMTDTSSPHHMTLGLEAVVYIQGLFSVCLKIYMLFEMIVAFIFLFNCK